MPDRRQHRGRDPSDQTLFADGALPLLRTALADLAWLLDRGYSANAALKLVGDRHGLRTRQRMALLRSACSDQERASRQARRAPLAELAGRIVAVDGFNCLITIEAALGGGVLLRGRDGVLRDLSSVHGSYKHVEETEPALTALAAALAGAAPAEVRVYLDRPVSNSGRLRALMETVSSRGGPPWQAVLVDNPDKELLAGARSHGWVTATSDGPLLDACGPWTPLAEAVIARVAPQAWIIDLGSAEAPSP